MAKTAMTDLLKKRMAATHQASELQVGDAAYEKIFQGAPMPSRVCNLPLNMLLPFHTADIGFKPYTKSQLEAFAQQLQEEGLLVRIIVRSIPDTGQYEILAGHNRVSAAKLAGWTEIGAEVVEADDDRAIVIATSTNLIQRHDLSIIERGKAYKALLDAKNSQGYRTDIAVETSGENHQKYSARALVAEFFGVTEYEIRKAIKLTKLIPEFQNLLETDPRRVNLACADLIADYDQDAQLTFFEFYSIDGYQPNKSVLRYIASWCPPPAAARQDLLKAWREVRAKQDVRIAAPPKKLTFDRRKFAPYLDKLGGEQELEKLFLEFLREKVKIS